MPDTPCIMWAGRLDRKGYGRRGDGLAHRIAYEEAKGPIPAGLTLDHLCRNRACVNPDHLEPVTQRVNALRGFGPPANNARKTHCQHGHEFSPVNTYRRPDGSRDCRTCIRERVAAYKRRRAA